MLWREGYQTQILGAMPVPALVGIALDDSSFPPSGRYAVALNFSLKAPQQREVWRRLFEAELEMPFFVGVFLASEAEVPRLAASVPRSQWGTTIGAFDPDAAWRKLIQPEDDARVFAAILNQGQAETLMVGPPTEEAWDSFLKVSRSV